MEVKIFKANLEKLSKCKGLKQSDLEGKYKKAYEALLTEIWADSNKILMYISLTGIKCLEEALADDVNAFIKADGKPIMTGCKKAVLASDYDSFLEYCYQMREAVKEMAWKYAPEEWDSIEFEQPMITD